MGVSAGMKYRSSELTRSSQGNGRSEDDRRIRKNKVCLNTEIS